MQEKQEKMNSRFRFRVFDNINKRYEKDLPLIDKDGDLCYQDGHKYCNGEHPEDFTIEQCIGVKDKNGNLIFEGDRCRVYDSKTGQPVEDTVYEVVFTESASGGCACFCFRVYHGANPNPYGTRPIYANGLPNIEIIGNIHDDQFRDLTKMMEGDNND
jgi:hypothetical protein